LRGGLFASGRCNKRISNAKHQKRASVLFVDRHRFGDALIVTGTWRSNRTVSESPVPIDVNPGEHLRQSGLT
jgi:hypothetical protein